MKVATFADIQEALKNIAGVRRLTPCRLSESCSSRANTEVFLKFENMQKTGSYKIRGATNKFHHLSEEEKRNGVIASSAGNHAQGVAYAASTLNIPAKIVMPLNAPIVKVLATRGYGAEVIQHGDIYDEAYFHAKELAKQNHYTFIPPFEDPYIIAGQGTTAIEIMEQVENLDAIIVPVGGGGLICGIALAVKKIKPSIKVIGVQAENVSNIAKSFQAKDLVQDEVKQRTLADGIAVKKPSPYMLDNYFHPYVDAMYTVSESEMADAMVFLLERSKTVVEASAAASVALAFREGKSFGSRICCVLTGGNVDLNILSKVIEKGLIKRGRIFPLKLVMADVPGSLSQVTKVIADHRANILEVYHDRIEQSLGPNQTMIEILVETFDADHIAEIKGSLNKIGATIL
tara:strand:+ start:35738 stop:36946 length:1209 start_codon:yes stop_codon:yes gene_type:complete